MNVLLPPPPPPVDEFGAMPLEGQVVFGYALQRHPHTRGVCESVEAYSQSMSLWFVR